MKLVSTKMERTISVFAAPWVSCSYRPTLHCSTKCRIIMIIFESKSSKQHIIFWH